jgi:RHS repeat-associated protein
MNHVDIIHMGGRIYDPTLGRFLQADPHIQAPNNSQNYNRYSYVLNNPMSYTDPSGFFFNKLFKGINKALGKFAPIVAIGLAFMGQGWAAKGIWHAAAVGFGAGGVATGSLKGALIGAFTGAAFHKIGAYFSDQSWRNELFNLNGSKFGGNFLTSGQIAGQIASHAAVGGVASTLNGGKFGHGFFSAGVTKGIGGAFLPSGDQLSSGQIAKGTLVSAVTGGTASKISGGKFANGAQTGAFQYLFNQAQESIKKWSYENQLKKGTLRQGVDAVGIVKPSESSAARRLFVPKGAFAFMAHGNEDGISLNYSGIPSSLEEIDEFLSANGYRGDKPILALACDLASSNMGQILANHYNQPVIGASSGHMYIFGSRSRGYVYRPKNSDAHIKEWLPND